MDLNNFDKHLKSSLENFEVPFDADSWNELESRMNKMFPEEDPAPVEKVDLVVKQKLDRLEVPYQTSHWNIMNNELNQVALVRRIRLTKLTELAIFLLLLLNIEGMFGGFKEVIDPSPVNIPVKNQPMASTASGHSSNGVTGSTIAESGSLASKVLAMIASSMLGEVKSTQKFIPVSPNTVSPGSVLDPKNFYKGSGIIPFQNFAPLPKSADPGRVFNNKPGFIPDGIDGSTPNNKSGIYAGTFAAYGLDFVSPAGKISKFESFGGGLLVGVKKGSWGLESGVSYTQRTFSPVKHEEVYAGNEIDGYLSAYVRTVNADVFSVPFKASKRIAKFHGTSLHAVAGATANFVTDKRFTYISKSTPPSSPSPDPLSKPDPSQFPIPQSNNDGLLEGGTLKNNVYASLDVGFRIEQSLGSRYVAFLEPLYKQQASKGFGPNHERINGVTIQAGILATL
ncbi:MAG: hypothetical protein R3A50_08875 [Saprospiraceae bacterium]|nr:hypothetical protein [Lewinellaceae bacterium]